MATKNSPGAKTYRALKRTWLSHESRMVEPGEVFTTEFPQVPKREEDEIITKDADGRLVTRRAPRDRNAKPEMVDMDLRDNIELADADEVSEPPIGTERGDKKIDREAIDKAMQDHVDRQRASLPSPGLPRQEGLGEPQRASDGPPTRETDDDRDAKQTPAARRAAEERKDAERRSETPPRGTKG